MKKLTSLIASLILASHLVGCTSSESQQEEAQVAPAVEGADGSSAGLEPVEGSSSASQQDEVNAGFQDQTLPDQAMSDQKDSTPADDPFAAPAENKQEPDPFASNTEQQPPQQDPLAPSQEQQPAQQQAAVDPGTTPAQEPMPPQDTTAASSPEANPQPASEPAPAPVRTSSLKKIETTPFQKGGQLLNAVYIARPGDTLKSVSSMIYGSEDKVKALKKANPSLKASLKPGEKVYYNSPQRPTDADKVITYYEDTGIAPEVYVSKEGDDLKAISSEMLGFKQAWKEVWATNAVESKGAMPAGTELRYWKSAPKAPETVATPVAAVEPVSPPMPPMNEPQPPPAPPVQAAAPPPAAPPMPDQAVQPAPPPPPMNPPPPTQASVKPKAKHQAEKFESEDNSQTMMMVGGALIAVLGGAAVMIRAKKRKEAQAMSESFGEHTKVAG